MRRRNLIPWKRLVVLALLLASSTLVLWGFLFTP